MIIKAKNWNVTINRQDGATYYQATGNVPKELTRAISQLANTAASPDVAARIIKSQFKNEIVSVEG